MIISVISLFPDQIASTIEYSIVKRAISHKQVIVNQVNLRDFSIDQYKSVDDHPYGGGTGMILRVDVIDRALQHVHQQFPSDQPYTILLDARGNRFNQAKARQLISHSHIALLCGHYEGVDERVRSLVQETISIGDFILTGGELPAAVIIDACTRLLPGVLKHASATLEESFENQLLEYPQYTKPSEYKGQSVPDILLSGNHAQIAKWRKEQSRIITKHIRPDMLSETS